MKKVLWLVLLFAVSFANAETIKTDVLVVGGGTSGVAAAIQCARSKVKTILVEPGPWLGGSITMGGMCVLDANRNLPSGIWGEFRKNITDYYRPRLGYDTAHNSILRFEPYTAADILKKMADTVKNLTVKLNTPFNSIKKNGTGWDVGIITNGEAVTIEAKVIIDATETGDIAAMAGAKFSAGAESKEETREGQAPEKASMEIKNINWIAILKDYGRKADKTMAKPQGYSPALYAYLKGKDIKQLLKAGSIPNDRYMVNWTQYDTSQLINAEKLAPENRNMLYKAAKQRTLGLVYYLQTELGYKNLGLDDQFNTPDHLPYTPYIREYRRVNGLVIMDLNDIYKPYDQYLKLYRTTIGVGDAGADPTGNSSFPPYAIPMGAVIVRNLENLLVTGKAISVTHLVNDGTNNPVVQMTIGQGAGTVAAYCAFFKTTTQNLTVRLIQNELLDFKGYLMPFTDIPQSDTHFRAVQQVCATGLLQGIQKVDGNLIEVHFEPNDIVNTAEVSPVLNELYTRAFLWFNKEKPGEKFTIGNLVSFISDYTLTEPKTLALILKKTWKTHYKLPGDFDMNRPVTRLEFAVLANRYLNPFAKRIDINGRFVN